MNRLIKLMLGWMASFVLASMTALFVDMFSDFTYDLRLAGFVAVGTFCGALVAQIFD